MRTPSARGHTNRQRHGSGGDPPPIPLVTPLSTHCYIIALARSFDSEMDEAAVMMEDGDGPQDLESALNASGRSAAAEESPYQDLRAALSLLNEDQMQEVSALLWVGRGDYDRISWREALQAARDLGEERDMAAYIVGTPLLGDYLEEGLTALGHDCSEVEGLPI